MRIIPREEWGARYGDGREEVNGVRAIVPAPMVALHHSVTIAPDLVPPFTDDYEAVRTIERIGAERFGEVYGCPYTRVITPAGLIFAGHHPAKMGAHTGGLNDEARAYVLVGNYEHDEPTEAQLDALAWLLRKDHADGWIASPQITGGHGQLPGQATLCPGRHAIAAIPEINRRALLAAPTDDEEEDEMKLFMVWNGERDTSPLLVCGGMVAQIADHGDVANWEAQGAIRVTQTEEGYEAIRKQSRL